MLMPPEESVEEHVHDHTVAQSRVQGQDLSLQNNSWSAFCSKPRFVHGLIFTFISVAVLCWCFFSPVTRDSRLLEQAGVNVSEDEMDAVLSRSAADALGEREGTIIVMDPQNGRLRAIVNQRMAYTEAFPPGSTIKPFAALDALRARLLTSDSLALCRERYERAGFKIKCAHPANLAPFDTAHALAYSCNYFFGKLGERLNRQSFDEMLASFGFGARTGINTEEESEGSLRRGAWTAGSALGEGEHLLATPIQLLTAYAALVNGGHLYSPRQSASRDFKALERARLDISPEHCAVLLDGMRGAIEYGTAKSAHLDTLPLYIFGKTGTATEIKGFHTNGWFIGFVAGTDRQDQVSPERVKLAVLVFLKHAHGAECAEVSRSIFEEYARNSRWGKQEAVSIERSSGLPSAPAYYSSSQVRVHLVEEDITKTISLEEYILGVVASEGSVEDELEALKALAVVSRTYALRNLGRHAREGFDFCNKTHCQRYVSTDDANIRELVRRAVAETSGEVLRGRDGVVAETYFHASCGGMTANIETLWGAPAPGYLRGVRDDYCALMPHHSWIDTISTAKLLSALRTDSRSDVGAKLYSVRINRRDETGRAEFITLEGERRVTLRGWDFKMIVGRALGWNVLKSSRFEVAREGDNFVFRGSGFGHGLGLCQEGAHVMAQHDASYRQILNHYFPGARIDQYAESSGQ